jgi:AcrR family transcriptional regulator
VTRRVDRAAAVRAAMRRLVAHHGLHGTSMAAVATEAGVATGTAYVHYSSKEELVIAAYRELKGELGRAATAGLDADRPPDERFRTMWRGAHRFLAAEPERARFLVQIDASPLAATVHGRALADADDPFVAEAARPDMAAILADLPPEVLYDLGVGPVVRLVAGDVRLTRRQLDVVAAAAWRAITRP